MKKKLIGMLLVIALSLGALSSCISFDGLGSDSDGGGSGTINVEGGPNYGDINITSTAEKNLLAASKALLSSVSIRCGTASAGSGVIYKLDKERGDAYVITNYHVIYDSNTSSGISKSINLFLYGMEMQTASGKNYAIPAKYVGGSMNYDIAILKVTGSTVLMESNAKACQIADSDDVTILDTAIAIGNPGAAGLSATVGCINVDSEEITVGFDTSGGTASVTLRVMRTDAAVNSGNSGGGLFNDNGELIGIVNAKDADDSVDNIGYAIPSNVAKAIADNAIHYSDGTVKRCLLGITVGVDKYSTKYDIETGKLHKLEEVIVTELTSTSGVKGIVKVGDVINHITVDGVRHDVTRIHHVVDAMLYARVGSTVTMNITRAGASVDLEIPITRNMLTVA